jgi:2-oxoglutarate ferredoxin oxidoreductase subunit beta
MKSLSYYKDKYLRSQPSAFCPGCGCGIILNSFLRAIEDLGIDQDKILAVSGIGCSAWIPSPNFKGDTLHTTHGRAIAFATGAKVVNPELTVVVFTGDGDGTGIGGNHLIHAARRNIDLTVILVNNMSYAMTGGQIAPTSFYDERTVTSPYGNPESPFDIAQLVKAAGASYVARWSTYHVVELENSVKEGIKNKGFSFIEVLSQCPTQQRKIFNLKGPIDSLPPRILKMFKESTTLKGKKNREDYFYAIPKRSPEETLSEIIQFVEEPKAVIVDHMRYGRVVKVNNRARESRVENLDSLEKIVGPMEGKIELGVFEKSERPEFIDSLSKITRRAQGRL